MIARKLPLMIVVTLLGSGCSQGGVNKLNPLTQLGDGASKKEMPKAGGSDPVVDAGTAPEPGSVGKTRSVADVSKWPIALSNQLDDKTYYGNVLCENGLATTDKAGKDDFTNIFGYLCRDDLPTQGLIDVINGAFDGTGTPNVTTMSYKVSPIYVTQFVYAYAVKIPLDSPAAFAALPIYDELGKGIKTESSQLNITKTGEKTFPGKGSVKQVNLDYDMPLAKAAAIHDVRSTETNNYLLVESTQDINLTTEHMVNVDKSEYYHAARNIVIGAKGRPGETYLIYVTELIIKNRFDPDRLKNTVLELTPVVMQTVYKVAARGAKK